MKDARFGSADGVCYMLTGDKHGSLLVTSLYSLREFYDGPVCLICGNDEADAVCKRVRDDKRLGPVEFRNWKAPCGGGKGLQHANKCRLLELSPFRRTVFIDADTLVVGPVGEMLPREGTEEVRLTQWSDWVTTGRKIQGRIDAWRELIPRGAAQMTANPYPAINTGVMGFSRRSTAYFARLRELCEKQPIFMCDELVAQLIFPEFPHQIMPDKFNYSCLYSRTPLHEARVIHFHGMKHVRSDVGLKVWLPKYLEARMQNIAGLKEWSPGSDRHLRKAMKDLESVAT